LSAAKESLFKKLHALTTSSSSGTPGESPYKTKEEKCEENHEVKNDNQPETTEDFQESNPVSPQNEPVLNFNPEERKGAYLEKIECGETLTYKIQVFKNKLMVEEGKLHDSRKQSSIKKYLDNNDAQQKMEFLIKEKEKEGYKNNRKKFVYNFQCQVRSQKKSAASSTHTQRTTQNLQQNFQRKTPAHQQNRQEKEKLPRPLTDSNLKRPLRSQSERNYATELQEALSHQTRSYCSFRPIDWPGSADPTGLILREKLNGVTCVWDGKDKLISLNRHKYKVPKEFIKGFPPVPLLGVVYLGPGSSYYVEMNLRSSDFEIWKKMKFVTYDILESNLTFKKRMEAIEELLKEINSPYIEFCKYTDCKDREHFQNEQAIIKEKKGDGLLLNNPNGEGLSGVNAGLYVWKNYTFEEAELVNLIYGENEEVKSFEVRHLKGNNTFKIHKGVKDLTKEEIPEIGDVIIYKTMGEKSKNVPKMPVFVSVKSSEETE